MPSTNGARRASPLGRVALAGVLGGIFALVARRALVGDVPTAVLVGALAVLLALVAAGVFVPRAGVFARPILAGPTGRPVVALTFDDGPDGERTRRIADLLEARGHRATFFVVGARVEKHASLCAELARRGHGFGNHSDGHSYLLAFRSARFVEAELRRASDTIAAATGCRTRWFRPPVGIVSPPIAEGTRRAQLEMVGWTARGRDGVARTTVAEATARLERALVPGAILVLHDAVLRGTREPIAVAVVEKLLDALDEKGLKSVTLDELLG